MRRERTHGAGRIHKEGAKKMNIALAGNANVGKSVIFNYLTRLHQHIGNWPGKTVEKAEGTLHFKDYVIDVIDLPGIYSLSTFSLEEIIAREYIAKEKPDVVINIIDASVLERNLFLTLQLIELGRPMVVVLNQIDMARKKGIKIDFRKLEEMLGVPVVPTVAIKGLGIYQMVDRAIEVFERNKKPKKIAYGKEIEKSIKTIERMVSGKSGDYPPRWTAIKMLEGDKETCKRIYTLDKGVEEEVGKISEHVEEMHEHSCPTAITCERYSVVGDIVGKVQKTLSDEKSISPGGLQDLLTHRIWGYPIMFGIILLIFISIFAFGDFFAGAIESFLPLLTQPMGSLMGEGILTNTVIGVMEGIMAAITVVIPFILPFYIILGILEDSGYLSRMAYMMDNVMHKIGLHGKAFIPMMMGFGCNVPACLGCRIMETHRERLIAIFVTTLVPCAAVTAVILGLVARFVSIWWAVGLYVTDFAIILILGRIAFRVLPGEPTGLIMEIPTMRIPQFRTTLRQAWFRMRDFVYIAFPIIIVSTVVIKLIEFFGILEPINSVMSPVTVLWLGLPAVTGIAFIFGILRKELTLVMLAALLGTTSFANVLTPVQMLVFAFVTMLYIPCAATIAALVKETGWRRSAFITVFEILFAIIMGGVFLRVLLLFA
jgi:ferrous iron transport protein B